MDRLIRVLLSERSTFVPDAGFYGFMAIVLLIVIGMNVVFWCMKPKK